MPAKSSVSMRREMALLAAMQERKDLATQAFYAGKIHGASEALRWALGYRESTAVSKQMPPKPKRGERHPESDADSE